MNRIYLFTNYISDENLLLFGKHVIMFHVEISNIILTNSEHNVGY